MKKISLINTLKKTFKAKKKETKKKNLKIDNKSTRAKKVGEIKERINLKLK